MTSISEPADEKWSDPNVETAKRMWIDGASAGKIAKHLGGGLTRSAVMGKLHRLGFKREAPSTPRAIAQPAAKPKAVKPPAPPKVKAVPKPTGRASKVWTPAKVAQLRKFWVTELTTKAISAAMGLDYDIIRKKAAALGLGTRKAAATPTKRGFELPKRAQSIRGALPGEDRPARDSRILAYAMAHPDLDGRQLAKAMDISVPDAVALRNLAIERAREPLKMSAQLPPLARWTPTKPRTLADFSAAERAEIAARYGCTVRRAA